MTKFAEDAARLLEEKEARKQEAFAAALKASEDRHAARELDLFAPRHKTGKDDLMHTVRLVNEFFQWKKEIDSQYDDKKVLLVQELLKSRGEENFSGSLEDLQLEIIAKHIAELNDEIQALDFLSKYITQFR